MAMLALTACSSLHVNAHLLSYADRQLLCMWLSTQPSKYPPMYLLRMTKVARLLASAQQYNLFAAAPVVVLLQVEDDKAQITAVIQQLDEKKRVALEETWKHVSHCYWGCRHSGPLHPYFHPKNAHCRALFGCCMKLPFGHALPFFGGCKGRALNDLRKCGFFLGV